MSDRHYLTDRVSFDLVAAAAVSAGTDVEGAYVDMEEDGGYDGVVFFVDIATSNAANLLKAQQDEDGAGAGADLAGTAVVATEDGNVAVLEVREFEKRYVRGVIDRGGANTATGPMYALRYRARETPVSHAAEIDLERHTAPAEGTA